MKRQDSYNNLLGPAFSKLFCKEHNIQTVIQYLQKCSTLSNQITLNFVALILSVSLTCDEKGTFWSIHLQYVFCHTVKEQKSTSMVLKLNVY